MCRWAIGMLALGALAVSGCGSTSKGATAPRPPAPVNLTVYIDNRGVSVSPAAVGAGLVAFIITNQASQAESLAVLPSGSPGVQPLASTGPIDPRATAQITVDISSPGRHALSTGGDGASGPGSRAAAIRIGKRRPSSDDQLLLP